MASVGQAWGLTETTVGATMPERGFGTVPGSVGRVMPSTELRVVDPDAGRDLASGERGELLVRGPQVMRGYLNRPEATAEMLDADGWLRIGDLGYVDEDGNVFVVDRLKDLIKVSAYHVAPAELEALLVAHPRVADAAVVGRPDERHGEVPVAVVVPRETAGEADTEEILAWIAERVAPHKRLRAVRFVDKIPRTPSGKLLRRLLAERVRPDPSREGDEVRRREVNPRRWHGNRTEHTETEDAREEGDEDVTEHQPLAGGSGILPRPR